MRIIKYSIGLLLVLSISVGGSASCESQQKKKVNKFTKGIKRFAKDAKKRAKDVDFSGVKRSWEKGKKNIEKKLGQQQPAAPAVAVKANSSLLIQKLPASTVGKLLQRSGYVSHYNTHYLVPNYVAWHLTKERLEGHASRKGIKWQEDRDVPAPRVDTYDYMQSGFDRGHMCPAADNKWSKRAMEESFLMTNVCPQNPNLNRGDWNEIEEQCRQWAKKYGSVYVVCGPIFLNEKHKRIGKHKVTVPEAFYKVVLCLEGTPKGIAFVCRNTKTNKPKQQYVNSIDDVERMTGIDFFAGLPDDIEQKVERQHSLSQW